MTTLSEKLARLESQMAEGPWERDGLRVVTQRGTIANIPTPQKGGVFSCQINIDAIACADLLVPLARALQECAGDLAAAIETIYGKESVEFDLDMMPVNRARALLADLNGRLPE